MLKGVANPLTEPPHATHLVPPKRMILSPTLQQHCRRRGHGPFPLGSIFLQERETKGRKRVHPLVTRVWPRRTAPQTPTSTLPVDLLFLLVAKQCTSVRLLLKCRSDARHSPGALPAETGVAGQTSQGAVQGRAPGAGRRAGSFPQHPAAVQIWRETQEPAPSAGSHCERRPSSQNGDCWDSLVVGREHRGTEPGGEDSSLCPCWSLWQGCWGVINH